MDTALIVIGSFSLLGGIGYYIYDQRIRKYMPSDFGIQDFQRIAKYESAEWRERAYKLGITRHEWQAVIKRQNDAIEAELTRRGVDY